MTVLIVSPSALLRASFKELFALVPGGHTIRELGSTLRLEAALAEYDPDLLLWDEALGSDPGTITKRPDSTMSTVILHAPGSGMRGMEISAGMRRLRMEKPDFATSSQVTLAKVYGPLLSSIIADIEARKTEARRLRPVDAQVKASLLVIGASTGGPAAVRTVLSAIPRDFPCPIALVQHIDTGYDAGYADWLSETTGLKVRLARENDRPAPGEVIVGPTDFHLVCRGETFGLDDGPKVLSQKPAVDRLFSSAARYHGPGLIAVLLTGIGSDGANGCVDIVKAGGITFVQDEATSTVYGMPRAAAERNAATFILALDRIGPAVLDLVRKRSGS
jgi:chemotaxis response regulator CheB